MYPVHRSVCRSQDWQQHRQRLHRSRQFLLKRGIWRNPIENYSSILNRLGVSFDTRGGFWLFSLLLNVSNAKLYIPTTYGALWLTDIAKSLSNR